VDKISHEYVVLYCIGICLLDRQKHVTGQSVNSYDVAVRYDRNYAPNVALSVEPFEAVRKLRAAESLATMELESSPEADYLAPTVKRRRAASSPTAGAQLDTDVDVDDEDDNESVSSDKRESQSTTRDILILS